MSEPLRRLIGNPHTLFDDEWPRKKSALMSKWEVLEDDGRNPETHFDLEKFEEFLQWGKTYRVIIEEVPETPAAGDPSDGQA